MSEAARHRRATGESEAVLAIPSGAGRQIAVRARRSHRQPSCASSYSSYFRDRHPRARPRSRQLPGARPDGAAAARWPPGTSTDGPPSRRGWEKNAAHAVARQGRPRHWPRISWRYFFTVAEIFPAGLPGAVRAERPVASLPMAGRATGANEQPAPFPIVRGEMSARPGACGRLLVLFDAPRRRNGAEGAPRRRTLGRNFHRRVRLDAQHPL